MKVARIDPPQGRLGRQRVVLDNGTILRLRPGDITALTLQPGSDLDAEVLHQLRARAEQALAQETAYRLLAVRLRSRHELTDRLRRRGISAAIVATVTADLERQGLLDDDRFADAWVRARSALHPSGPIRLRAELAQKGVAREVITRTLGETLSSQEERTLAEDLARGKLRRYRGLPVEVTYRRLAGVLARRGFSAEIIAKVLRDLLRPRSQVNN